MKRLILFYLMCICASVGVCAAVSYQENKAPGGNYAGSCVLIQPGAAGELNADKTILLEQMGYYKTIFVVGPVNSDDIETLNEYDGENDIILDLTLATGLDAAWFANITSRKIKGLGVPEDTDLALTNENLSVVYATSASGSLNYDGDSGKGGQNYRVNVLSDAGLTFLQTNHFTNTFFHKFRSFDIYGTAHITEDEKNAFGRLDNIGSIEYHNVYGGGNAPYTVSGCDVVVNMAKADGKSLTEILTLAKAAVVEEGQEHICTLTVAGTLNNTDLATLGDASMAGATRIDLSGVTLAAGATVDNLKLPASLQQLVLQKDQTATAVLVNKFAALTDLDYAFSPSSSAQDANQAIPDYIYVNKAKGLKAALETETASLRNSHYLKVASQVALDDEDVNLT